MAIKKKLLNIVLLIKKFWEQMQKIKIGTCEKKKRKYKESMEKIDIKTSQKIKRLSRLKRYQKIYHASKKYICFYFSA